MPASIHHIMVPMADKTYKGLIFGFDRFPMSFLTENLWKSKDTGDPGFYYHPIFRLQDYMGEVAVSSHSTRLRRRGGQRPGSNPRTQPSRCRKDLFQRSRHIAR